MIASSRNIRSYTYEGHQCDHPNLSSTKRTPMTMTNSTEKFPWGHYLTQGITRNWIKLGVAKVVLHREEHTNYWTSDKWSTLKTFIYVMLNGLTRLHLKLCMYMQLYSHSVTIGDTIGNEVGEQWRVHG